MTAPCRSAPPSRRRTPRAARAARFALLLALLAVCAPAAADEPGADPLLDAVKAAVAAGRTQNTPARGFHVAKRAFTEVPQAGVLVGLECGVGKFLNIETVYAVRAIYHTSQGVQFAQEHGLFADRPLGGKKIAKSPVVRRVRLQAPEGYAVGAITVRSGVNINGLSLTYMKVNGAALDPRQSIVSAWVGDRTGGSEGQLSANGGPVVGIHGSQDDTHVQSLGLVFVAPPVVPAPPVPPAPQPPAGEPMAPLVAPEPPPAAPPPPPPVAADPGPHPPRPGIGVVPPAIPALKPAPNPALADAAQADEEPAGVVEPAAKPLPGMRGGSSWLSMVVFAVVAALVLGGSLAFVGIRKVLGRGQPSAPAPARPRAVPPPLPPDEPDATAIRAPAHPGAGSTANPPVVLAPFGEEPIVLLPADAIQTEAPPVQAPLPPPAAPELPPPIATGPDSCGATRICGQCRRAIPAELGRAPWCPHCGRDLRPMDDPVGRSPAGASSPANAALTALVQPPYFVGRITHTYRIYVLPNQLLFLYAPALEDESGAERMVRGVSVTGGLLGAAIGGVVAGSIAQQRRARAHDRHLRLDLADTEELVDLAEREPESFRLEVDELHDARIEAMGFWENVFAERCAAHFRFRTVGRGQVTVVLPRPDDVRVAIKQLTAVVGDRLSVNAAWDWGKNRFVPRN